jgi:hypothetical protein
MFHFSSVAPLAATEQHLHIHVETANGKLLSPGAILSKQRLRHRWLVVVAILAGFCGGVAASQYFPKLGIALQAPETAQKSAF